MEVQLLAAQALAKIEGRIDVALRVFQEIMPPPLSSSSRKQTAEESFNATARFFIASSLREFGEKAVPLLLGSLGSPSGGERAFAVWALGQMGSISPSAIPVMPELLADPDRLVRVLSACTVWKQERRPEIVVPVLVEVLQMCLAPPNPPGGSSLTPTPSVRELEDRVYSIALPAMLRAMDEAAVPFLLSVLSRADAALGEIISAILGTIAMTSSSGLRALHDVPSEGNVQVSRWLRKALEHHADCQRAEREAEVRLITVPPALELTEKEQEEMKEARFELAMEQMIEQLATIHVGNLGHVV
jgi:hypothetical protein